MRAYPDITTAWRRLATYLGPRFRRDLTHFDTLRAFLDSEFDRLGGEFYHHSIGYLYDLTHFHYTPVKDPFFDFLRRFADEHHITAVADIGCGVALDAQALLKTGLDVHGYDLDNPCLHYARWRLRRDLAASERIHTIDHLTDRHHQLAYALDVLGHTHDPPQLIETLFTAADYVCLNLAPHDPTHRFGPMDLHPALDHQRVLDQLTQHGELIRLGAQGPNVVTLWRATAHK